MAERCSLLGLALCLCLAAAPAATGDRDLLDPTNSELSQPGPVDEAARSEHRYREGTRLVDRIGQFKTTGDRLTFYTPRDDRRFPALENLALERVAHVISESSDNVQWSVSGVVTEFRGQNYLLVTRAILSAETTNE